MVSTESNDIQVGVIITVTEELGRRWVLLVERDDGHGWALPGGHVDAGEDPVSAALRELRELCEESDLVVGTNQVCRVDQPCYVPDPCATDEAVTVTIPVYIDLGRYAVGEFPAVTGAPGALRAAYFLAGTYSVLLHQVRLRVDGQVSQAHRRLLHDVLG